MTRHSRSCKNPGFTGHRHSESSRQKMSDALKGRKHSEEFRAMRSKYMTEQWKDPEYRAKMSQRAKKRWEDPNYRAKMSGENCPTKRPEVRAKNSAANIGENNPNYGRTGKQHPMYGKNHTEEIKAKIGAANTRRVVSEETKAKMSGENNPFFGKTHSEETRKILSAKRQGISIEEWTKYTSFEPYCELFNHVKKEEIRNRDERRCQLCGKSEILNGARLSVHHIDGDKIQGCDGKRWYLCALCRSCNARADTPEKEFLIVSNLNLANEVEVSI